MGVGGSCKTKWAAAAVQGGSTTKEQPKNVSATGSETGDIESLSQPSPVSLASLAGRDFIHLLWEVIYGCHEAASG